jgi:hypothetical protein
MIINLCFIGAFAKYLKFQSPLADLTVSLAGFAPQNCTGVI